MKMIEDWMLQANREVPDYIKSLSPKDAELPFIYRIHDTPADDRIEDLRIFLKAVGYELGKAGSKIAPGDINKLLAAAKGSPEETVVQMATLRSMAKAIYSHANIGHFSLGFENYTHFTSPIRRYPDMLAHRLLASHIKGKPISKEELESYRRACVTSSEREVAAAEAERESIKYKQIEFLENRIGQTFEGTITGVAEHGIYVAEKESRAEGLLRVANLKDDYYSFDKKHYALVGQRNKKSYRLGDAITVKLYAADPLHRQIDWMLA
jgi:ribonuclease R